MNRTTFLALSSVSFAALAAAAPAAAQTQPPAPQPESCANIQDDAQRQACAQASEQVDPLANQGEEATLPTQGATASSEGTQAEEGVIVVTGSRLRRDERTSADPVTVIDPDVENREGKFGTAEVLQNSPIAAGSTQITSTISSNFVINGGEGVETVSLRGLGANRTLVLLNGRRAGPAGVRGGVSAFDLNVIPIDVIQSIEILKTGASSIYGSDAVAGVVNLITKKDLRGLDMRAFVSAPEETGGGQYSIAANYGFGLGDRGHLMFGANYNRVEELERGDRSYLGCEEENVTSEATGETSDPIDPRTGKPYCGAFTNNVIFLSDFTPFFPPGTTNLTRPSSLNGSVRPIQYIQFNNPGNRLDEFLTPIDPASNPSEFTAPPGFFPVGAYDPTALALMNLYDNRVNGDSVIPKTDRFTLFAEAGYDLTDNVSLYFEGLYNRRKTKTDGSRQLFFDQFTGNTIIPAYGIGLPYFYCDGTTCDPFAAGDPLNTGFTGTQLLQPIIYAPADSSTDVKYYRGVAGARANLENLIPKGFADFYFQHSRSDGDYKRDIIFRDAIEFGVAELRTELCAGTVTAIRGVPCIDINYTDPRVLAGRFTPEEAAFLFGVDRGNTLYKQNTAELTVGGDAFTLPAGPVKFALGGHWRRDSIRDVPGEATLAGNIWASTTSGITAGYMRTLEAFGEVEVPLLRDLPMVHELTLNGAARVTSTYAKQSDTGASDSDKGNWTYKIAGNWTPVRMLRLRATYGTSFRSPALFEQFLSNESGFLSQNLDPCRDLANREVSATTRANCLSQGIPLTHLGGSSFETFSGGGIGVLDPETSKALTLSAIFTPDVWLWSGGQFSFAVDYIDIEVKDQVTQLGAGNILAGCYESDNFPDDPLCALFTRDTTGTNPSFDILEVQDPFLNIDTQRNKSLDFTTRFRQDLGRWGNLSMLGQLTYQLKDKFTLFQGFPADFNGQVGDPKWVGDLNVSWTKAPVTVTYGLQMIAGTNNFDDLEDVGGDQLTENNCLNTASARALRGGPYCPVYKLPRVAYHSLSAEFDIGKKYSFLVGVSNLFDKKPPLVSTVGTPITAFAQVPLLASYYDYIGRRLFVSARLKLGDLGF